MKIVKTSIVILLLFITVTVLSTFALLHTQTGLDITLKIAKRNIPAEITYTSAIGAHNKLITLTDIHIKNPQVNATIKRLTIRWDPLALLSRTLKIDTLTAEHVNIVPYVSGSTNNTADFSLQDLKLPMKLSLKQLSITDLKIESENKLVKLYGNINDSWDLNWELVLEDKLNSTGKISGPLLHPIISTDVNSQKLQYKNLSLTNLHFKMTTELDILERSVNLNNFLFTTDETGNWNLKTPTKITHHKKHYEFTAFCLQHHNNHFCANGKWHSNNTYELNFSGNKLPLNWMSSAIHPDLKIKGQFDLNGTITGNSTAVADGKINFRLHPGKLTYPIDLQTTSFPYTGGSINANLNANGLTADLDIQFIEKSTLNGHIDIPEFYWLEPFGSEQNIDAKIAWHFPSIHFFQPLIPIISELEGALHVEYYLKGTMNKPQLNGNARLEHASFKIPKLHTEYSNIQGDAIAKGKQIDYTLSAKAGDGNLSIQGRTLLSQSLASMFTLKGKNALISDSNGVKLYASPELNLEIVENHLSLQGNIHIPKALIKINDYNDTVSLPDEVVFINDKPKKPEPKWQIYSNINLSLGDDIRIDGMGIKAKLGGELKITDTPEKTTVAHGLLNVIEGSYKFYSSDLKITKGSLIFTGGPINNPAVNVSAVRHFSGTQSSSNAAPALTVGLNITGTLNKPEINLFSTPERYSESDILSFLLLGQPLEQAGSDNANILLSAASAIDIGGAGKLSHVRNQIKNTLGLTELDLTSETEYVKKTNKTIQHTALVLGKYLSPKLYVKYSFDVLDHSNRVQLRYWLNKNWSLQTESRGPESSGVDVLYSIERR